MECLKQQNDTAVCTIPSLCVISLCPENYCCMNVFICVCWYPPILPWRMFCHLVLPFHCCLNSSVFVPYNIYIYNINWTMKKKKQQLKFQKMIQNQNRKCRESHRYIRTENDSAWTKALAPTIDNFMAIYEF